MDKLTAQLEATKVQLGDAVRVGAQLREKSAAHEEAHGRSRAELISTQRSHAELASQVQAHEARALSQELDADGDGVGGEAGESLSAGTFVENPAGRTTAVTFLRANPSHNYLQLFVSLPRTHISFDSAQHL